MYSLKRAIYVLKEEGIINFFHKIFKYLLVGVGKYKGYFYKYKIRSQINNILDKNDYEFIDLFIFNFGWEVQMYQRPQHIAVQMSNMNGLVLYASNPSIDKNVNIAKKIKDNLYIINISDSYVNKYLLKRLIDMKKIKFCHTYASDTRTSLDKLKEYENMGFKILYEYVDEIHDSIFRMNIPKEHYKKHKYILENCDYYIVVSADKLYKEVIGIRGNKNCALVSNGVEYSHWQKKSNFEEIPEDIRRVVVKKKKIIGYFGALASWFDYNLIEKLANERPEYEIVLIGIKHDRSYAQSNLDQYANISFLGAKEYKALNNYVHHLDVCIIPFILNEVTQSTSPIKLFEYMAAEKPIVTTAMPECLKYNSVLIGNNHDDFIKKIDLAMELKDDEQYIKSLKQEALINTWEQKTNEILNTLLN